MHPSIQEFPQNPAVMVFYVVNTPTTAHVSWGWSPIPIINDTLVQEQTMG
jgi:hypothetical protein